MNKEIKIDLRRCFEAILKKWWLVVITAIVFFTAAYLYTYNINKDEYVAKTTVYSVAGDSYQETVQAALRMTTYRDIITSLKISERAASLLGDKRLTGHDIQNMIEVEYADASTVLEIKAYSEDKNLAIKVANAVASAFIIEIGSISGGNTVQLLDGANTTNVAYDGRAEQFKTRMLAIVAGIILPSLFIALREILTTKIYNVMDVRLDGEINIIGIIPSYEKSREVSV